jgi:hypothetical protein
MKRLMGAMAMTPFLPCAGGDHGYHGFCEGGSSRSIDSPDYINIVSVRPGTGDAMDTYRCLAQGRDDLSALEVRRGCNVENPTALVSWIYGLRRQPGYKRVSLPAIEGAR